jgi:hypothetical protein
MKRSIGGRLLLLAILVLAANDAAAQAPVESFADLQPLIKEGQQVVIQGDDGRKITGAVVSLTGNQLEIRRERWFGLRPEHLVFMEASVRRIEHKDSDWNGSLIGGGLGLLAGMRLDKECREHDDFCDLVVLLSLRPAWPSVGGSMNSSSGRSTSPHRQVR